MRTINDHVINPANDKLSITVTDQPGAGGANHRYVVQGFDASTNVSADGRQRSGSMRLDPKKLGGNGRRWIAFREWLTATAREAGGVQVVYVEDVRRHVSNLSARVYCGYLAMLEAWCAANNVRMELVGVGTIKKAFTGNGRADKDAMVIEARRRGMTPGCDNEADAIAILAWGVAQEI